MISRPFSFLSTINMVPPLSDKIKKSASSPSITKRALPDALPLFSSMPESSLAATYSLSPTPNLISFDAIFGRYLSF